MKVSRISRAPGFCNRLHCSLKLILTARALGRAKIAKFTCCLKRRLVCDCVFLAVRRFLGLNWKRDSEEFRTPLFLGLATPVLPQTSSVSSLQNT
jgi:hypothetical protein